MALPNEHGIEPPNHLGIERDYPELHKWLLSLYAAFPKIRIYFVTIDPPSLSANSITEVTVSVTGLDTADIVVVDKPSTTAGVGIVDAYVSATDTLAISFINDKGSPTDPPSEVYRIMAICQ